MSPAHIIATKFTAVDKFSPVMEKMSKGSQAFANNTSKAVAHAERGLRRLTPALSDASKQFLSFASTAAITAGIFATFDYSTTAIKDYENALASFRTIVGGTNEEFKKYSDESILVAKATKSSSVDVVKAFESIAGINADLAKTPKILGEITASAIIMAKGSGDELQKSAENLVGIMNQFNLAGHESGRVIDVLAAGQAVGASTISKTADAFTVFGAVADSANISVEKSTALVQVLASKMIMGAEAGTHLRGSIGLLQKSGFGYKNGLFDINEALTDAKAKYDALATAQQKDAFIANTFGEINKTTGTILLSNIDLFDRFTSDVSKSGEAQKAAALKTSTFTAKVDELKASWVTMITGSENTTTSLNSAKWAVEKLTDNLGLLVSIGSKLLIGFIALKTIILLTKGALFLYNVVLGVTGGLSSTASIAIGANSVALAAYTVTAKVATIAATAWAWALNIGIWPLTLIAIGIAATIALITVIIKKWDDWGAALTLFMGPLGMVISLIQSFRRNWEMIGEAFRSDGFVSGILAIGKTIVDALLMPIQQLLELVGKFTGMSFVNDAAKSIETLRMKMGVSMERMDGQTVAADGVAAGVAPMAINPKQGMKEYFSEILTRQEQNVTIGINDNTGKATVSSDNNFIPIKLSSTLSY